MQKTIISSASEIYRYQSKSYMRVNTYPMDYSYMHGNLQSLVKGSGGYA